MIFIRGASRAKDGKPIIAIPSTAKGGQISRIVPMLDPGAGVVTSQGSAHYVVTEYGVAYLSFLPAFPVTISCRQFARDTPLLPMLNCLFIAFSWPALGAIATATLVPGPLGEMLAEIASNAAEMYLDLLKKSLTRFAFPEAYKKVASRREIRRKYLTWLLYPILRPLLAAEKVNLFVESPFDPAARTEGKDWPANAETMIGLKRLENLQYCITQVLQKNVPGDCIETGVWRGGASIFMRGILKAYGDRSRTVWVADSFEGLPKPDARYPQDKGDKHWKSNPYLGVSLEQVKANFARYGLLDEQVRFLAGWFKDSLPTAPIQQLAILRLDGDMYSSTTDALQSLYAKLSPGGFLIVDDYGSTPPCRQAVDDFRARQQITEPIQKIDWAGIFWQKSH